MANQTRDMDLYRKILIQLSNLPPRSALITDFSIDGYDNFAVAYHVYLLQDAGLIEAGTFGQIGEPGSKMDDWKPTLITDDGQEFLNSIRQDTVWENVKSHVKATGSEMLREGVSIAAKIVIDRLSGAS